MVCFTTEQDGPYGVPHWDDDDYGEDEFDETERFEILYAPENDPTGFSHLRNEAYVQQYHELVARMTGDPTPTAEELEMGAYVEDIEPQVREAVLEMRRKGYNTISSGFGGTPETNHRQHILGSFTLTPETTTALRERGVTVHHRYYDDEPHTTLEIEAESLDLEAIAAQWLDVVALLPAQEQPAAETATPLAEIFRQRTARGDFLGELHGWLRGSAIANPTIQGFLAAFETEHPERTEDY